MLDERKINAITLLLSGKSKTDTAKIVGISRQTLYDWLNESEFVKEMRNQREELIQSGTEKLTSRLDSYLDVLHTLATSSTDKRTQATCAMYLTDRILGKTPSIIESKADTNILSRDLLEEEFKEFDNELRIVK